MFEGRVLIEFGICLGRWDVIDNGISDGVLGEIGVRESIGPY